MLFCLRVEFVFVLHIFVFVVVYLCLLWLFLESVFCVAVCVVGSGRVGLRVTLLMEGVMCATSFMCACGFWFVLSACGSVCALCCMLVVV